MTMVTHGVRTSIATLPIPPLSRSSTVLFVVGTGTGVAGTDPLAAFTTSTVVTSVDDAETKFGDGTIVDFCKEAFSLSTPFVVAVRYDETIVAAMDLQDAIVAAINVARVAIPRPTVGFAPGLTYDRPGGNVDTAANPIAVQLQSVASTMGILAILDCDPTNRADALAWAALNGGNASLSFAGLVNTPNNTDLPISSYIAARIAANDRDRGLQNSVGNKVATGVVSVTPAWSFDYQVASVDAQVLDAQQVGTVVHDGRLFKVWGGSLKTTPANDPLNQMGAYRVVNLIQREIARLGAEQVDEDITPTFPQDTAGLFNRYLGGLVANGLITAGHYQPDPAQVDALASGAVHFIGYIRPLRSARLIDVQTLVSLT